MRLDLPDDVDPIANRFQPVEVETRTLLNSIPKSGTHILRNIVRMFVGNFQTYRPFVVDHDWHEHALGMGNPDKKFFCGHVNFGLTTMLGSQDFTHILLVRDPFDYVMSYARFLYSEELKAPIAVLVRREKLPFSAALSLIINGIYDPQYYLASIGDVYRDNAIKWLTTAHVVRYEDLVTVANTIDEPQSQAFLVDLLGRCGVKELPDDWRERVRVGADPKISATASHRLHLPEECKAMRTLPETARLEIETLYPGLRAALGYGSEVSGGRIGEKRSFAPLVKNERGGGADQGARSTGVKEEQHIARVP